ncbi:MAG: RtcB family protein [Planctomycetota bacterium]
MNARQLGKLGVPAGSIPTAIQCFQNAVGSGSLRGKDARAALEQVIANPSVYKEDAHFGPLARELAETGLVAPMEPIAYKIWGTEIDEESKGQMRNACSVPMARAAALMPDAHVGYGLPIGGVLALEGAVIPYAVGVDIACRMKLSVFDLPTSALSEDFQRFRNSLEKGTCFGVGGEFDRPKSHPVMDLDWSVSRVTREKKDKAWKQLGTSGSGNHFVEFGTLHLEEDALDLGLPAGEYVALLSHSGSRGTGAAVCDTYSNIARARLPKQYADFGRLAWLSLDTQEGQEYWAAMNLMGEYASANHDVIHKSVTKLLGGKILAGVENHHNFAWKETHGGKEWIVHRKGATPAALGELAVIPGTMSTPAYVVRGKGNPESLCSASHGAGRRMSRTQARSTYNFRAVQKDLEAKGVHILSAGADEVPMVYKDIDQVMKQQQDLVEIIARFDPKIVKMCGDGSRAED